MVKDLTGRWVEPNRKPCRVSYSTHIGCQNSNYLNLVEVSKEMLDNIERYNGYDYEYFANKLKALGIDV